MHQRANPALALAALLLAAGPLARSAERITLRNGFVQLCNHHAQIEGRVRLYLTAGEDDYIEFPFEEIATVEQIADPAPQADSNISAATPNAALTPILPQHPASAPLNSGDLHQMLNRAGQAHNLNVDLLASVVKAESDGNAHAVSHAGAQGLMQLMPQTAADLGVHDSFAPEDNVRGGTAYLDSLLTRYHDNLALALAAYNAGPAAVDKYHGIPPYAETRAYVARVIHEFNRRVLARAAEERRTAPSAAHVNAAPQATTR